MIYIMCFWHKIWVTIYDLIEQCLIELKEKHNKTEFGTVFGKVHHLSSGGFNEYWWDLFNETIKTLYEKTNIKTYYLYLCEYDGECLTKYKYVNGEKIEEIEVKINISDTDISCDWNINSLVIHRNITICYNKKYRYDYW